MPAITPAPCTRLRRSPQTSVGTSNALQRSSDSRVETGCPCVVILSWTPWLAGLSWRCEPIDLVWRCLALQTASGIPQLTVGSTRKLCHSHRRRHRRRRHHRHRHRRCSYHTRPARRLFRHIIRTCRGRRYSMTMAARAEDQVAARADRASRPTAAARGTTLMTRRTRHPTPTTRTTAGLLAQAETQLKICRIESRLARVRITGTREAGCLRPLSFWRSLARLGSAVPRTRSGRTRLVGMAPPGPPPPAQKGDRGGRGLLPASPLPTALGHAAARAWRSNCHQARRLKCTRCGPKGARLACGSARTRISQGHEGRVASRISPRRGGLPSEWGGGEEVV